MIINNVYQIESPSLMFYCKQFLPHANVYLKLEGLNIAGSIKFKPAIAIITNLEKLHVINKKRHHLIESSSGNLGVALSIVVKAKGYKFTCITDPHITPENEKLIKLYGGEIIKITEPDETGGYLRNRIRLIEKLLTDNPNYIWLNQYANLLNPASHYQRTAREMLQDIPNINFLFIGAGTTGTLMGCASYFKKYSPQTTIVAVDSVGSVTFNQPAGKRYIPGIGTSRRPEITNDNLFHHLMMIPEKNGVAMCRYLLNNYGLAVGGSTGSVMYALADYAQANNLTGNIVAISPDFGHKYIDNVYSDKWVEDHFGNLSPNEFTFNLTHNYKKIYYRAVGG